MARGVNKVILVGHLGQNPEVRYTPDGKAIASMSVAVSEQWKDKNTGDKQERTEWINVVMFGRLGEIAGEYLTKGSQVYIEGKLKTDKFQDKETGKDRYSTKVIASEMQMLGGGQNSGTPSHKQGNAASATGSSTTNNDPLDFYDDDVGF